MPTYFVGNVLPPTDAPGENDRTFDFTADESASLDLNNIPIRIEHEEGLAVGTVRRDWCDKDGTKWILGQINDDTLESRYASHAIRPSSDGHTLYGGLSLQHVHTTFGDGSTKKRGIEVSLCTEPRRPGCVLECVEGSKKKEYITHLASTQKMSAENSTPVVTETPVAEASVAETSTPEAPVEQPSTPAADTPVAGKEELMNLVLDQEKELGSTKVALEKAHAELQKMQSDWKMREDNERLQTKSKAEALSKALVTSWEKSLPADMMTEENKKAIFAMAQNFPKESVKMLEIAHKASAKYKDDLASLERQQKVDHKRELESRVMDVVTKRRRVVPDQPRSVVHAANAKAKVNPFAFDTNKVSSSMSSVRSKNPHLFGALSKFSGGNLRDRMGAISRIGQ